jgi:hypothetical protein
MSKFSPHLACDADLSKAKYPLVFMHKVDGCRILVRDGRAVGRSLKTYKNKKMTAYLSHPMLSGIEGEVIATYPNDPDLCRKTTSLVNTIDGELPKSIMLFEYLSDETKDLGYGDRMKALDKVLPEIQAAFPDIDLYTPEMWYLEARDDGYINLKYQEFLEDDYEGMVLRDYHGKHKDGRATVKEAAYLRMKPTGDSEGICIRLEEAFENQNEAKTNELGHTERSTHNANMVAKGMVGALLLLTPEGKEIKIGAGKMTHDERIFYWNNPDKIVGEPVKYAFLAVGEMNKPRHGRYISIRAKEDMS